MSDLGWRDAIIKVLEQNGSAMHYTHIADAIVEGKLRPSFGATPATSVNVTITDSLKGDEADSPFVRIDRGIYGLRKWVGNSPDSITHEKISADIDDETGLINALGMYWAREKVQWSSPSPKLLGQQQPGSKEVDFYDQRGVYLLHDGRSVVYVGRVTDQALGLRLRQHTLDRLNGRWDRFSWFGTSAVTEDGRLEVSSPNGFSHELLVVTMEALLIEALEPPQNRKRGDDFRAIEFLQVEDPDIRKKGIIALLDELKTKI